jgi:hypothetical protein
VSNRRLRTARARPVGIPVSRSRTDVDALRTLSRTRGGRAADACTIYVHKVSRSPGCAARRVSRHRLYPVAIYAQWGAQVPRGAGRVRATAHTCTKVRREDADPVQADGFSAGTPRPGSTPSCGRDAGVLHSTVFEKQIRRGCLLARTLGRCVGARHGGREKRCARARRCVE